MVEAESTKRFHNIDKSYKILEKEAEHISQLLEHIKMLGNTDMERANQMNLLTKDYRTMMMCLKRRKKILDQTIKELKEKYDG